MATKAAIEVNDMVAASLGQAELIAMVATLKQALAEKERRDQLKILRIAAVEEKTGRKKSWIYAAVRAGTFPPPISLGGRASGWLSREIDEYLEQQIKASRARNSEAAQ